MPARPDRSMVEAVVISRTVHIQRPMLRARDESNVGADAEDCDADASVWRDVASVASDDDDSDDDILPHLDTKTIHNAHNDSSVANDEVCNPIASVNEEIMKEVLRPWYRRGCVKVLVFMLSFWAASIIAFVWHQSHNPHLTAKVIAMLAYDQLSVPEDDFTQSSDELVADLMDGTEGQLCSEAPIQDTLRHEIDNTEQMSNVCDENPSDRMQDPIQDTAASNWSERHTAGIVIAHSLDETTLEGVIVNRISNELDYLADASAATTERSASVIAPFTVLVLCALLSIGYYFLKRSKSRSRLNHGSTHQSPGVSTVPSTPPRYYLRSADAKPTPESSFTTPSGYYLRSADAKKLAFSMHT